MFIMKRRGLSLLFIFLTGCATQPVLKSPPKNYLMGLKEIAYSLAKKMEKGKKVVVLNFTSIQQKKELSPLNIYFAHIFSSYLSEASLDNFIVIDREKGEKIVEEDIKFEIGEKNWKEVLERFKCEYYVIGEYLLSPTREIEFVDISLMKKSEKIWSKSGKFPLTEEEYNKLKEMAYGDVIENTIEGLVSLLERKISETPDPFQRVVLETSKNLLRFGLEEYRKCKLREDCSFYELKDKLVNEILKILNLGGF